ncbi:MAG: hypothetical protein K2Q26_00155 [Bdellovibrionales bacterium]|nr:hypothetical protein [Bdellovibrionales bacterium]
MKKRTSLLILTALLAGVFCIVFLPPQFFESFFKKSSKKENLLGIKEVIGTVQKISPLPFETVTKESNLHHQDLIITHADSKILFFLPTQGEVWVMPFSKVEIYQDGEVNELRLIFGEIKKPAGSSFRVSYRGAIIQNDEFSTVREALVSEVPMLSETTFKDISLKDSTPQNMIEKQIFQTLLLNKKFFQACLVKYYKKEGGKISGGETVFDLLISPNGVIEKSTIIRSEMKSADYHACLEQVLTRVRFKGLTLKESVHAVFPLNIEL